jgi:peptidoglycan/xylan/chitin deacetylase (PgdA/CDA1 family)
MSKHSFRYLVLIAFVLSVTAILTVPSKLFEYWESPKSVRSVGPVDATAPPLTDYLPAGTHRPSAAAPGVSGDGGGIAAEGGPQHPVPEGLHQPILVYHHVRQPIAGQPVQDGLEVTPETFAAQLSWLEDNGWSIVSLSDYVDALEGKRLLPDKAAVLTFDDGNRNQFENALPLLQEHGFKATFFIYPNAIGKRDDFMDWGQVKALVSAGMDIGSHSAGHPRLYQMTDPVQIEKEVLGSKIRLEQETGVRVDFFAYPFGVANEPSLEAIRHFGYRAARIYPYGPANSPEDAFKLKSVAAPINLKKFVSLMESSLPK